MVLKHISQSDHEPASDGAIYAYSWAPFCLMINHLVKQPDGARWEVWMSVHPLDAPREVREAFEAVRS